MAIRYSDAAASLIADDIGLRKAVNGGHIVFFTGTQPSSANNSPGSSQPIISFTLNDGVYVAAKRPEWSVTFSSIQSETTVTSIAIGGIEVLSSSVVSSDINTLCSLIASNINDNVNNIGFSATSNAGTITFYGPYASGNRMDSFFLVVTNSATITKTYNDTSHIGATSSNGNDSSNGLSFNPAMDGSSLSPAEDVFYISKKDGEYWKGLAGFGPATSAATSVFSGITSGNTYTAGWGRLCVSDGDNGLSAADLTNNYIRVDFSVGTLSADVSMLPNPVFTVNTTLSSEIEYSISSFILKIKKKMS